MSNLVQKYSKDEIMSWSPEHRQEFFDNLYLELGDTYTRKVENPFSLSTPNEQVVEEFVGACLQTKFLYLPVKHILNLDLFPYQYVILDNFWNKKMPMLLAARGAGKTFNIAIYIVLRALLDQGTKVVVAGTGLRSAGIVFEKISEIWENAPILRDICGGSKYAPKRGIDSYFFQIGRSTIKGIPVGAGGDKIRGLRANVIACDEFGSMDKDIFERVIRAFASVDTRGAVENVQDAYKESLLREIGIYDEYVESSMSGGVKGNQVIIAGTATYQFNHFYEYFNSYKSIVQNKGLLGKSKEPMRDWDQHCIIRIPYKAVPEGLMDRTIIEQGAAVMNKSNFDMEYNCVFARDSEGFFPASVIHRATAPFTYNGEKVSFTAELTGSFSDEYVMGIDPASERDNLTISIAKLCDGYREHIYTWSTNRKRFEQDRKRNKEKYKGITDYNTFIIHKIHDLFSKFNIVRFHLDSGGGGRSIIEGLKDKSKVPEGSSCIYDMDDDEVAGERGSHVIKVIEFSSRNWYEAAHYNLLKDLTAKSYLFPYYDSVAIAEEATHGVDSSCLLVDTIEGALEEIEQVKYQTTLIHEQTTPKGHKKWDLPKMQGSLSDDIKGKMKRDHFTSLLLVNDAARGYLNKEDEYNTSAGGMSRHTKKKDVSGHQTMYYGKGANRIYQSPYNTSKRLINRTERDSGGSIAY